VFSNLFAAVCNRECTAVLFAAGQEPCMDYFFPYLRRGHQFDHVGRGVQERRVEDSIKSLHFFSITLMSDCLYFFPIYLRAGKKLLVYFPMMSSGEKILFCKKVVTEIFPLMRRYFSITVCCLFTYIFSPLALFKVSY
jgi:hypothetical protein